MTSLSQARDLIGAVIYGSVVLNGKACQTATTSKFESTRRYLSTG